MNDPHARHLLWWVIPGALAGMPMPYIDVARRMSYGTPLTAFEDDLIVLHNAGIRAVVSLLNLPTDAAIYQPAGFDFLCLPVPDGGAPSMQQADDFVRFVSTELAQQKPVAVHCHAGIGRTGTMLATYLISQGLTAEDAIYRVREVERTAIETSYQIQFLELYAERFLA